MARAHYRLSIPAPHTHLVHVEARFDDVAALGDAIELRMAAWTPGSYLVRDYARHVEDVTAADQDGAALAVRKIDKAGWQVSRGAARSVVVRYRVYAWELTVRTNHVDDSHAFLNGAPTYLWIPARAAEAATVTLELPAGWQVACALTPGAKAGQYTAASVDELVDSPIHAAPEAIRRFTAAGKPTELAVWGRPEGHAADLDRLVIDLTTIIEHYAQRFGGVPYERYVFQLMLCPGAYGGLEHKASTALLSQPSAFSTKKKYEELLELASHEFFHLWNVKRIRPRVLGPFDYTRENYTRALWVMEGVTSYVDRYTLRRTGLIPAKRYLDKLASEWGKLLAIPGRHKQSIEESSFDAWVKLYRPDENSVNSTVSYYLKGGLVALCLDLELRRRSAGQRSLDDVLGLLWRDFGARDVGFDEAEFQALCERAGGMDLGAFFDRSVRGRQEPDLAGELEALGLNLRAKWEHPRRDADGGEASAPAHLGVTTRAAEGGRAVVVSTLTGSPAEAAGLYAGDELVALEGFKLSEGQLGERLAVRRPGDVARFTVFRRDELREVAVPLGEAPKDSFEIVARDGASDEDRARQLAWLGETLPVAAPPAAR